MSDVFEGNKQVGIYTLGTWLALPDDMPVENITMIIVQPRTPFGRKDKRADVSPMALLEWSAKVLEYAEAAQDPDAPFKPGPWCGFCPIGGNCAARLKESYKAAQIEFDGLSEDVPGTEIKLPELRLLTPKQIGQLLDAAPNIIGLIKAAREYAKEQIEAGKLEIPGWKVVEAKKAIGFVEDELKVASELQYIFGVPEDKLYTKKLISFAKARDYIAEELQKQYIAEQETKLQHQDCNQEEQPNSSKKPKKAAAPKIKKLTAKDAKVKAVGLLGDLTEEKPSGTTLVCDSDERPAIGPRGQEFDVDLLEAPPPITDLLAD